PALPALPCPLPLAEHLRFEPPQRREMFPRVARQPGFVAGVGEKGFCVPAPFGCHLWQQQTPMPSGFDDEAVAPDLDVIRSGDRLERSEKRDLDLDLLE